MDELYKTGTFTYDYVRFAPQRQIDLHSQKSWELDYILTGRGVRTLGDSREPFREGEIILVPPGMPHQWRFDPEHTDAGGKISNISLSFDDLLLDSILRVFPDMQEVVNRLQGRKDAAVSYSGDTRRRLAVLLSDMRYESAAERPASFLRILQMLGDVAGAKQMGAYLKVSLEEQRKMQIRTFIASNLSRPVSLKEIASHVGMNEAAFCVFFKKHYGRTFIEYLNARRLEYARNLLEKGELTVAEVCYACGFSSPPYFSRLFRKSVGMSPQQFARSARPRR